MPFRERIVRDDMDYCIEENMVCVRCGVDVMAEVTG
jgi:hypothetical protein